MENSAEHVQIYKLSLWFLLSTLQQELPGAQRLMGMKVLMKNVVPVPSQFPNCSKVMLDLISSKVNINGHIDMSAIYFRG